MGECECECVVTLDSHGAYQGWEWWFHWRQLLRRWIATWPQPASGNNKQKSPRGNSESWSISRTKSNPACAQPSQSKVIFEDMNSQDCEFSKHVFNSSCQWIKYRKQIDTRWNLFYYNVVLVCQWFPKKIWLEIFIVVPTLHGQESDCE